MKKIIAVSSMLLAALVCVESVYAGSPGFYAGAGLGISRLDTKDKSLFHDKGWTGVENSVKRGGLGWKLFTGYNFNEFVGAELGYTTYAHSKYSSVAAHHHSRLAVSRKNSMRALSLVAKGSLPVGTTGFNLYALGGGAQVNNRVEYNGYGGEKSNKLRPTYGAGIGYAFSEQLSTQLEVSRIKGEREGRIGAIPNADSLTLNLAYNFN